MSFLLKFSAKRALLAMLCMSLLGHATVGIADTVCSDTRVELRGEFGQARFTVEIADTDETRARGLMFRDSLPRSAGMLFVYDQPQPASFWMMETRIPLDMIFVDERGEVSHIHHEAIPMDRTPIDGGDDVLMVLEINGGLSRALGLAPGNELRHPRLDPEIALWPC